MVPILQSVLFQDNGTCFEGMSTNSTNKTLNGLRGLVKFADVSNHVSVLFFNFASNELMNYYLMQIHR